MRGGRGEEVAANARERARALGALAEHLHLAEVERLHFLHQGRPD